MVGVHSRTRRVFYPILTAGSSHRHRLFVPHSGDPSLVWASRSLVFFHTDAALECFRQGNRTPSRLRKNSEFDLVLKGRGFSRAVSAAKSNRSEEHTSELQSL